ASSGRSTKATPWSSRRRSKPARLRWWPNESIEPRYYVLHDEKLRSWVALIVLAAPLGCVVTVEPARRSKAQNALLHALISEAVGGGLVADDRRRLTLDEAKVPFASGSMIAKGHGSDVVYLRCPPVRALWSILLTSH